MDAKGLIDGHVRTKLEDTFGKAVAMMIMATATTAARVPLMEPSLDEYLRLVDCVCDDPRVQDMWGKAGSQAAREQWRSLARG
ncbi:MAG TPA: hypothetical protein VF902_06275 [Coriobacteriia bacterium]